MPSLPPTFNSRRASLRWNSHTIHAIPISIGGVRLWSHYTLDSLIVPLINATHSLFFSVFLLSTPNKFNPSSRKLFWLQAFHTSTSYVLFRLASFTHRSISKFSCDWRSTYLYMVLPTAKLDSTHKHIHFRYHLDIDGHLGFSLPFSCEQYHSGHWYVFKSLGYINEKWNGWVMSQFSKF